jgi:23S rRNA (guanosine2251-2'-O)-methyltransferase
MKDSGLKIVAASEKTETDYTGCDLTVPLALIVGSEESGITTELLALADERVRIPVHGEIESLNVSVAAGILLYEVLRQRSKA